MQNLSHRIFNGTIAAVVIAKFYQKFLIESILFACGLILFSSFPDNIEKIGLKHRGMSHSLVLYLLLCFDFICLMNIVPQAYWPSVIALSFLCGCLGHVFADVFSKNGIKVLGYPLKFGLYSTGKINEQIFLFAFIIANIAFILLT